MVTSVIFLIKKNNLNRHIKHENPLSIYENADYFQIMSKTNLEWERERLSLSAFLRRGHRGPYSPYKPFNHNLHIGIIIFPHIDNPQSTGYN